MLMEGSSGILEPAPHRPRMGGILGHPESPARGRLCAMRGWVTRALHDDQSAAGKRLLQVVQGLGTAEQPEAARLPRRSRLGAHAGVPQRRHSVRTPHRPPPPRQRPRTVAINQSRPLPGCAEDRVNGCSAPWSLAAHHQHPAAGPHLTAHNRPQGLGVELRGIGRGVSMRSAATPSAAKASSQSRAVPGPGAQKRVRSGILARKRHASWKKSASPLRR